MMILNRNDEQKIKNPTTEAVHRVLSGLQDEDFAILSSDDECYLQAMQSEDGFIVEYRDGDYTKHFQADEDSIPLDQLIEAFLAYMAGEWDKWKKAWKWCKVDFAEDFEGDV